MRGRHRITVCVAAIALLFVAVSSYAKTAATHAKSSSKTKKIKPVTPPESMPASRQTYLVRKGGSLFKIARENQTTPKALKAANGLKGSKIKAGQTLVIPGSQVAEASVEPPKTKSARNEQIAAQYISQLKSQNPTADAESFRAPASSRSRIQYDRGSLSAQRNFRENRFRLFRAGKEPVLQVQY